MSLSDVLSGKLMEEFSAITLGSLLGAVFLAFILGLFIVLVYKVTYSGAMFSKSFALCLVLLSMITALVILTISSNVVLSLGMVGALSIVRFRTAVKEPLDTVFMFWAIAVGLITGAGYIPVAIIATLLIGVLFVGLTMAGVRFGSNAYLLVVHYQENVDANITLALKKIPHKLKSRNMTGDTVELVMETRLSEAQMTKMSELKNLEGVKEVNLISYNGSTLL